MGISFFFFYCILAILLFNYFLERFLEYLNSTDCWKMTLGCKRFVEKKRRKSLKVVD